MNTSYEIGRKWVLDTLPVMPPGAKRLDIVQTYLSGVRIRRANDLCYMTVKGDSKMADAEWGKETPIWVFDQLLAQTNIVLTKTRHVISRDELKLDFDVYHGQLQGLITVEAEWLAEGEAVKVVEVLKAKIFVLPAWIGPATEVTRQHRYSNAAVAQYDKPRY